MAVLGEVMFHTRAQNTKVPPTDQSVFCKKAFLFTEGPDAQPRVHEKLYPCVVGPPVQGPTVSQFVHYKTL